MFTGIVQALGRLEDVVQREGGRRLAIGTGALPLDGVSPGDSIAANGVCLTVTDLRAAGLDADVSTATLEATTLGRLERGAVVNLEKALTLQAPLGGHLVSGHVDGVGEVVAATPEGESVHLRVRVPDGLSRYIARKGSVCIDGVSLTVNEAAGAEFEANLVPYTLANTTLGKLQPGDAVNVEVDMIARYLERLVGATLRVANGER